MAIGFLLVVDNSGPAAAKIEFAASSHEAVAPPGWAIFTVALFSGTGDKRKNKARSK